MIKKYCSIFMSLLVWGCAPSSEFQASPQAGARVSGTFPRFSDRPEAETSQLSPETRQNLGQELTNEAKKQRLRANAPATQEKNQAQNAQAARAEAEEVLRQIEQGNSP